MTLYIHLQIVGILLMLLGLSHIFFNRYFGWGQELVSVSLLTRQVFFVHNLFHRTDRGAWWRGIVLLRQRSTSAR